MYEGGDITLWRAMVERQQNTGAAAWHSGALLRAHDVVVRDMSMLAEPTAGALPLSTMATSTQSVSWCCTRTASACSRWSRGCFARARTRVQRRATECQRS